MNFHPFNLKAIKYNDQKEILSSDLSTTAVLKDMAIVISFDTPNQEVLHGNVYFQKSTNNYFVFSFLKEDMYNSLLNHGFFLLDVHKNKNQYDFVFRQEFISAKDFIQNEDDFVFVCNLFVGDNRGNNDLIKNNEEKYFLNRNIKVSKLMRNNKFLDTLNLILTSDNFSQKRTFYHPLYLDENLINISKEEWQVLVSMQLPYFDLDFRILVTDNYQVVFTGTLYKQSLNIGEEKYTENVFTKEYQLFKKPEYNLSLEIDEFIPMYSNEGIYLNNFNENSLSKTLLLDKSPFLNVNKNFEKIDRESDYYMRKLLLMI